MELAAHKGRKGKSGGEMPTDEAPKSSGPVKAARRVSSENSLVGSQSNLIKRFYFCLTSPSIGERIERMEGNHRKSYKKI